MRQGSQRGRDWISAVLLFLMLQVVAARLVATEWAPNLHWTESLAGLGAILGFALGVSRFRWGTVAVLTAAYTATVVPWQLTAGAPDDLLVDRLNRVGWILWVSLNQFMSRLPVKDPLFFVSLVCIAFWFMGIGAGYSLARHGKVTVSMAAAGASILIIQAYGNYQPRGSWWLAIFLLLALLAVGRVHFLGNKDAWDLRRVFVSEESGTNLLSGLFMTATLVILIAWWIPTSSGSLQRASDLWNTYVEPVRERLSNAVTSLEGPYGGPGRNFYGGSLGLGQNAATGDTEVLTVTVLESPDLNMRYYWRGRTYNVYDGGLWTVSTNAKLLVHPEQGDLIIPDASGRAEGLFEISSEFPSQSLMYAPAPVVWSDRTADVVAMRVAPNAYDAFSWDSRVSLTSGGKYQVRALLRNPSIAELRAAPAVYPDWISGQYLVVPDRDRKELRALAGSITAGEANPFDRAMAITTYLRQTIEYSSTVPAPPEGQDPVMWVLFDHKKGFCNYSASAEVLLLRSIGIPARLAVGFARGELEAGVYTVFRRDAHAWPEVYFPGIGWVEFEPTSNQPPLSRPAGEIAASSAASSDSNPGAPAADEATRIPEDVQLAPPAPPLPFRLTPFGRALFAALPFVLGAAVIALAYRLRAVQRMPSLLIRALEAGGGPAPSWIRWWEAWNDLEPIERTFAVVGWTLRLIGKVPPRNATPAAQAAALGDALPAVREHVDALREELEKGLFTPTVPNLPRARTAAAHVFIQGLRARVTRIIAVLNGGAVYSE